MRLSRRFCKVNWSWAGCLQADVTLFELAFRSTLQARILKQSITEGNEMTYGMLEADS